MFQSVCMSKTEAYTHNSSSTLIFSLDIDSTKGKYYSQQAAAKAAALQFFLYEIVRQTSNWKLFTFPLWNYIFEMNFQLDLGLHSMFIQNLIEKSHESLKINRILLRK